MASKKYISQTGAGITFPVLVGGKRKWISLDGDGNDFVTSDKNVQAAIEKSMMFTKGLIGVADRKAMLLQPEPVDEESEDVNETNDSVAQEDAPEEAEVIQPEPVDEKPEVSVPDTSDTNESEAQGEIEEVDEATGELTSYPDVIDINGAAAVLRAEPYKVHHMKLKTPSAIKEQAALNKVVFPNWAAE